MPSTRSCSPSSVERLHVLSEAPLSVRLPGALAEVPLSRSRCGKWRPSASMPDARQSELGAAGDRARREQPDLGVASLSRLGVQTIGTRRSPSADKLLGRGWSFVRRSRHRASDAAQKWQVTTRPRRTEEAPLEDVLRRPLLGIQNSSAWVLMTQVHRRLLGFSKRAMWLRHALSCILPTRGISKGCPPPHMIRGHPTSMPCE